MTIDQEVNTDYGPLRIQASRDEEGKLEFSATLLVDGGISGERIIGLKYSAGELTIEGSEENGNHGQDIRRALSLSITYLNLTGQQTLIDYIKEVLAAYDSHSEHIDTTVGDLRIKGLKSPDGNVQLYAGLTIDGRENAIEMVYGIEGIALRGFQDIDLSKGGEKVIQALERAGQTNSSLRGMLEPVLTEYGRVFANPCQNR